VRLHGTVIYRDGERAEFEAGSAQLAEYELYALRHGYPLGTAAPPMLSMLVVAWSVLVNGDGEGFDTWRRRVADIDFDADELASAVPPTPEAPSSA
jgi:hypothetical protein